MKRNLIVVSLLGLLVGIGGVCYHRSMEARHRVLVRQQMASDQNKVDTWQDKIVKPTENDPKSVLKAARANQKSLGRMKTYPLAASYAGGRTQAEKTVEAAYIFVATIKETSVSYTDIASTGPGQNQSLGLPTSIYHLTVLKNIKGELPVDQVISAKRHFFGPAQNQAHFLKLIEDEVIPEIGKTYVCYANVSSDQELMILEGGDYPSLVPLDKVPMHLDKQTNVKRRRLINQSTVEQEAQSLADQESELLAGMVQREELSFVTKMAQDRQSGDPQLQVDLAKILVKD